MALFSIHFTPEEANALLPMVRDRLSRMKTIAEDLEQRRVGLEILAMANSNGRAFEQYVERTEMFVTVLEEMRQRGILVKDVDTGLVDFPAWRDGEEVLLCWRADEPSVAAWHDLESGFAGRQPL